MSDDKLFMFIQKCNRNKNKPDMHSFTIMTDYGKAFVECREDGIFVDFVNRKVQTVCNAISATNLLEKLNADYETIDM